MARRMTTTAVVLGAATGMVVAQPIAAAATFDAVNVNIPSGATQYTVQRTTSATTNIDWKFDTWTAWSGDNYIHMQTIRCNGTALSAGESFSSTDRKAIATSVASATCFRLASVSGFDNTHNYDAGVWWNI